MKLSKPLLSICCTLSLSAQICVPACLADDFWPGLGEDSSKQTQQKKADEGDMIFDGDQQQGAKAREGSLSGAGSLGRMETPKLGTPSKGGSSASASSSESPPAKSSSSSKETTLTGGTSATMLYGRIDQIAAEANVKMPDLKALKAQLDPREARKVLQSSAQESHFSGSVTRSFPMDFSGVWGGEISVWRFNQDSLAFSSDSAEANKMQQILTPGTKGNVNFVFRREGSAIDLEPAQVRIMIPMDESYSYQKMMQGGQLGGLGSMMKGMMGNMRIPVMLHFGTVSTGGNMEVGISGNQLDQRVVKNVIRQLKPGVLEQQIITRNSSVVQGTGKVNNGYTETVMRFTRRSPQDLYVLAASVDYDGSGRFERKLIMYGDVYRNRRVDTSMAPAGMGNMSSLLRGAGGAGGAGGLSSLGGLVGLSSMMGSGGGGGSANIQQYANNANMQNYLSRMGMGGGAAGSRINGFSQVLNSLNMMNR